MDKKSFRLAPFFDPAIDKWIGIEGPYLLIQVDFDDVDHGEVQKNVKKMLKILNENWEN